MEPQQDNLDILAAAVEQYVAEILENIHKRSKATDKMVRRKINREIKADWERIILCIEAMSIIASSKN